MADEAGGGGAKTKSREVSMIISAQASDRMTNDRAVGYFVIIS